MGVIHDCIYFMEKTKKLAHLNSIIKDDKKTFSKEDLFNDKYLIDRDNSIEIYYAPFEYINKTARILIVGITPGWTQTEIAFETFVREYRINNDIDQALMIVKKEARKYHPDLTDLAFLKELDTRYGINDIREILLK